MKLVINACYGGFSLSRKAVLLGREISGNPRWGGACIIGDTRDDGTMANRDYGFARVDRDDEHLVDVVEKLGSDASGSYAKLKVVEIPDGVSYEIEEHDGYEHVAETHQTWG